MYFTYPKSDSVTYIADDRVYIGGAITTGEAASKASVTEHSYFASDIDETVTLFDNKSSGSVQNQLVTFDYPCYDLQGKDGLTVDSVKQGANYAYVSGVGILTGKKYSHGTMVLTTATGAGNRTDKEASVTNATLVSLVNSANVLKRVSSYYGSGKTVNMAFKSNGEMAGD